MDYDAMIEISPKDNIFSYSVKIQKLSPDIVNLLTKQQIVKLFNNWYKSAIRSISTKNLLSADRYLDLFKILGNVKVPPIKPGIFETFSDADIIDIARNIPIDEIQNNKYKKLFPLLNQIFNIMSAETKYQIISNQIKNNLDVTDFSAKDLIDLISYCKQIVILPYKNNSMLYTTEYIYYLIKTDQINNIIKIIKNADVKDYYNEQNLLITPVCLNDVDDQNVKLDTKIFTEFFSKMTNERFNKLFPNIECISEFSSQAVKNIVVSTLEKVVQHIKPEYLTKYVRKLIWADEENVKKWIIRMTPAQKICISLDNLVNTHIHNSALFLLMCTIPDTNPDGTNNYKTKNILNYVVMIKQNIYIGPEIIATWDKYIIHSLSFYISTRNEILKYINPDYYKFIDFIPAIKLNEVGKIFNNFIILTTEQIQKFEIDQIKQIVIDKNDDIRDEFIIFANRRFFEYVSKMPTMSTYEDKILCLIQVRFTNPGKIPDQLLQHIFVLFQCEKLTFISLNNITLSQMQLFTAPQLDLIKLEQYKNFSIDQLNAISPMQINQCSKTTQHNIATTIKILKELKNKSSIISEYDLIKISKLSKESIEKLTTEDIQLLSITQMTAFKPSNIVYFNIQQINIFSIKQLESLHFDTAKALITHIQNTIRKSVKHFNTLTDQINNVTIIVNQTRNCKEITFTKDDSYIKISHIIDKYKFELRLSQFFNESVTASAIRTEYAESISKYITDLYDNVITNEEGSFVKPIFDDIFSDKCIKLCKINNGINNIFYHKRYFDKLEHHPKKEDLIKFPDAVMLYIIYDPTANVVLFKKNNTPIDYVNLGSQISFPYKIIDNITQQNLDVDSIHLDSIKIPVKFVAFRLIEFNSSSIRKSNYVPHWIVLYIMDSIEKHKFPDNYFSIDIKDSIAGYALENSIITDDDVEICSAFTDDVLFPYLPLVEFPQHAPLSPR